MAQLLSNLPIGSRVKFGRHSINGETPQDIIWKVVSKSSNITLLTENIIDFRPFDASEPNNPDSNAKERGYNRFVYSNLRQWLNSDASAGNWYTAQHAYDSPPSNRYAYEDNGYVNRPGFLNTFTDAEKNAILITDTVSTTYVSYSTTTEVSSQKVFLPSVNEMNGGWSYFADVNSRRCTATNQAYTYATRSVEQGAVIVYWLRDGSRYTHEVCFATSDANVFSSYGTYACEGNRGVRPAINLSTSLSVSDVSDGDGCYTVIWNSAPSAPSGITPPTIYGGKSNLITWGTATDFDGDVITYSLDCSVNGGGYTEIYRGVIANYAHLVPFGTSTVSYRVKAADPSGESSAYTYSATVTVINNNAPVISGADGNLGVKSDDFTGTYTITDANNNTVTVTEAIDGVQIRALVATLGQAITYGVTEKTWLALPNGSHTLTISATDGIDTTVRTYVFTKLVDTLKIQNSTPWVSSTMPTRIMLVITRNIPSAATFKVEVCNNGYDASPTWEDCTDAVRSGLVHVFSNAKKTATDWGVLVRVTVARNGATGACYISAIGGNFE